MNLKVIYNISIIGLGSVGLKHLESLFKLQLDFNIYLIDIDQNAVNNAKILYKKLNNNKYLNNIFFMKSLVDTNAKLDLLIISCNSNNRKEVLEEIFKHTNVKNIILEKIVFQSSSDFLKIIKINEELNINIWVNCNKRCFPIFNRIKEEIGNSKVSNISVEGGNWNIASNAIHFLDIFYFLTGNIDIKVYSSNIETKIYKSKRNDYIDLNGEMTFINSDGSLLRLINLKHSVLPVLLYIQYLDDRLYLDMTNLKLYNLKKANKYRIIENNVDLPHMSDFSYKIIYNILINNECSLINLNEARILHKPIFKLINQHLYKVTGKRYLNCPIT